MFSANKSVKTVIVSMVFLAITACSSEPSDSDIKTAVGNQMKAEAKAMAEMLGSRAGREEEELLKNIKNMKKIGCKADGDNAYKCDVELEVTRSGTTNKGVIPMRFVKGSDGWMASK